MAERKYIPYIADPNAREMQVFPQHYFSGCDVSIEFNNITVSEVAAFQYSIQEQHKPIYSYASRTFDEMAIGNRIVVGSFRLAIKEAQYLNKILHGKDPVPTGQSNEGTTVTKYPATKPTPPAKPTTQTKPTTPTTNAPAPKTVYRVTKPQMKDANISKIQQRLKDLGYFKGTIDGYYGQLTESAVKGFQDDKWGTSNGMVDENTWNALMNYKTVNTPNTPITTPSIPPKPSTTAWPKIYYQIKKPQMKDNNITKIQQKLKELGYNPGEIDGQYGAGTEKAVKAFQKAKWGSSNGIVGEDTWNALFGTSSTNTTVEYPGKSYKLTNPPMSDSNVTKIQNKLKSKGYTVTATGKFTSETDKAVRAFQKNSKITVDGIVGTVTWKKLFG